VYIEAQINEFFYRKKDSDGYVLRRIKEAKEQLDSSFTGSEKKYVFIYIELDGEYGSPFEEVQQVVTQQKEIFKKSHGLDLEVIISPSPGGCCKSCELLLAHSLQSLAMQSDYPAQQK